MISIDDNGQIPTCECPQCFLCGSDGDLIHVGMKDRLYQVQGVWNSRKCRNESCGLVWLDPMPRQEEIHRVYATYYTHQEKDRKAHAGLMKSLHERLLRAQKRLLKAFIGSRAERENHYLMYLSGVRPGRLLEIGCGNGRRLSRLQAMGWQAEGQEVDEKAWAAAREKYHLQVHLGELKTLSLGEATYDAVVMSHVIEHVHEPVELLAEVRRLLKPGGILVVTTPNAESQAHGIFKENWFSLEPPRHLYIYSTRSIARLAMLSGLSNFEIWTTNVNSDFIAAASLKIKSKGNMKFKEDGISKQRRILTGLYFQLWASTSSPYLPEYGEECVLKSIR